MSDPRPQFTTLETRLIGAFRGLNPDLKRVITQGVLPETERELLEHYRALSVRERTLIRALCADRERLQESMR